MSLSAGIVYQDNPCKRAPEIRSKYLHVALKLGILCRCLSVDGGD